MNKHTKLIKKAFRFPGAPGSASPWRKWRTLGGPEPRVTAEDVEGSPFSSTMPSDSSSTTKESSTASSTSTTSAGSLEDLVDEFLASKGGGSAAKPAASAASSAPAQAGNPYQYPESRRPRYIDIEVDGNVSSKDLKKILKQVRKMAQPYPPSYPYRYQQPAQAPAAAPAPAAAAPAPAAASPNGDPASLLKDFLAYAKSKNVDLGGVSPTAIASALGTEEPTKESAKEKDTSKKEYSDADLERKKKEIDEAAAAGDELSERYGTALDNAMEQHDINRRRWNRYRHWSPAISAASTIGGGILADHLYSKYILRGKSPAAQTNWEWWQRFLAARVGNVGGYLLGKLPNRLLRPAHDMSRQPYPIPSEIK